MMNVSVEGPRRSVRTPLLTPRVGTPPQLHSGPPGEPSRLEERILLFACALVKDEAMPLIDGLPWMAQETTRQYASQILALSPQDRHGRLLRAFGVRRDALERLEAKCQGASPSVRRRLQALLHPSNGPSAESPSLAGERVPQAMLASRLLREALR